MPINRELLIRFEADNRAAARNASPASKALSRLERRIKERRDAFNAYQGYSINTPRAGDYLLHMRGLNGKRKTVQIGPFGGMRWLDQPCVTFQELLEAA